MELWLWRRVNESENDYVKQCGPDSEIQILYILTHVWIAVVNVCVGETHKSVWYAIKLVSSHKRRVKQTWEVNRRHRI